MGDGGPSAHRADDPARRCPPLAPRVVPLDVHVQPEAGDAPLLSIIAHARRLVRVIAYKIGPSRVLDALARKVEAGVRVRMLLDGSPRNRASLPLVREAGIDVRWSDPRFELTHAKVIVADDDAAVISTGNFGPVIDNRDFLAIDRDPADVAAVTALFEADWDRAPRDHRCARLVIAPDNARDRIIRLIGGADRTLDVESMQLGDVEVRDAIVTRRAAGVRVRVVLADAWDVPANEDAAAFLAAHRIRARYLVTPFVHAKAIVADGRLALIGSINLTNASLSRNREVGVIVDEPRAVATIAATVARDWAAATPFAPLLRP